MKDKIIERDSWEYTHTRSDDVGYTTGKTIYRAWQVKDGWEVFIHRINDDKSNVVFLPNEIIETIKKESVKKELKDV